VTAFTLLQEGVLFLTRRRNCQGALIFIIHWSCALNNLLLYVSHRTSCSFLTCDCTFIDACSAGTRLCLTTAPRTTSWPTPLRTAWISSATRPAAEVTTARTLTGAFPFCMLGSRCSFIACSFGVYIIIIIQWCFSDSMIMILLAMLHASFNAQGGHTTPGASQE